MAKNSNLQQAVRFALAAVSTTVSVSPLHAQTAPAQSQAESTPAPMAEVVVTGSRLQTPNQTSISPITTVSAADVQATGLTRVEDVLNNLPMVFAGMNSTTSNGADGTAALDLRGLGNQRTLTLVDGLRLGPGTGAAGRNYSDINEIPAALVQRVDILTGGASAVYGADAVAGVVNFILNTHFEGVKIDAGYHFSEHNQNNPDGVQQLASAVDFPVPPGSVNTAFGKSVSIIVGSNFAENKGNATAYITYDNQGAALQKSFDYSACSLTAVTGKLSCGGSETSAKNGAGGAFFGTGTNGVTFLSNTVDGLTNQFRPFQEPGDLYNYGPLNYYQTPNERWTAGAFLNYEVNSHATVYANVMIMRNSMQAQIAASGDFGNPSFIACADPLLNASEKAAVCNPAYQAAQGNPYEIYNGTNYPGLNLYILRRNVEGGPRIASFATDSAREVFGIKGEIDDAWNYNVSLQHSSVDQQSQNLNYFSNAAVQQSLNVLPGPGGAPVCGGPNNALGVGPLVTPGTAFSPGSGCVPWNIWTSHGVTPAQLAYLSIPQQSQASVLEYDTTASVTGDLGKYGLKTPLADDGLQLNVGSEWREDGTAQLPDYVSQQGFAAGGGGATPAVTGEYAVWEGFTEARMPLAQHQAFAEDLALEAGYRYSSYTEGFETNTYKLGLEWAPIADARFRASFNRAVRAPNIGELYSPQAVGLDGSVDPCASPLAHAPAAGQPNTSVPLVSGATYAQCARTGVTQGQYGNIQANSANQYNGLLGGDPTLKPETADTYTVGLVLSPRAVPNLNLSFDYFHIDIKNKVGPVGGNAVLLDCLYSGALCNQVHRDNGGSLWLSTLGFIVDPTVNEGELKTQGVDVKGSYRTPLASLGSLRVAFEGTYMKDLSTTPVPGGAAGSYDCAGYFGATCGGGNPTWRHVMNFTWSTPWDALDVNLRWRYFGSDKSEDLSPSPLLRVTSPFLPLSHIAAYNYFDLATTFNLYKSLRLELGVNNVMDKDPPLVVGQDCTTSSPGGANCNGNTFPGVYDAMGRYIFANISAQF
ncbi:MAG TPA: TonB-dependent receptor [Steroidobacteraceae bacterium]|jgi:iron complex outermembrane receptor protein|nr:TonB-dependent receptor [Steroidobacteraceae bacterium]